MRILAVDKLGRPFFFCRIPTTPATQSHLPLARRLRPDDIDCIMEAFDAAPRTPEQEAIALEWQGRLDTWVASYQMYRETMWINMEWLVAMTLQSSKYRKSFFSRVLATRSVNKCCRFYVSFSALKEADRRRLADANLLPTHGDCRACVAEMAAYWKAMPKLVYLELTGSVPADLSLALLLCASPHLYQVHSLLLGRYRISAPTHVITKDNQHDVGEFIGRFQQLASLTLNNMAAETFLVLGSAIAALPGLKNCELDCCPHDGRNPVVISSAEEANVLCRLLESSTLNELRIEPTVRIDAIEASDIVGAAIMASRIQEFCLGALAVWNDDEAKPLPPVAESTQIRLAFYGADDSIFWEHLAPHFRHLTFIQELTFDYEMTETMAMILKESGCWTVGELLVSFTDWNAVEAGIVSHVSENKMLQKLFLCAEGGWWGPEIDSKRLLKAIDCADSSLVSIRLNKAFSGSVYKATWRQQVNYIVKLNVQRVRVRAQLGIPSLRDEPESTRVLRLLLAPAVEQVILFEFLRRNEWQLQQALSEARRVRKRPRDEGSETAKSK